jgi:hypothetical protein
MRQPDQLCANFEGEQLQYEQQSLLVSRHLFRWTEEIAYADYYELVLGRDPRVMTYMLPQGPGSSKARSFHGWGTPYGRMVHSGVAMAPVRACSLP